MINDFLRETEDNNSVRKAIIADDEPLYRNRFANYIKDKGGFDYVDEVPEGEALLEKVQNDNYAVVFLDNYMPPGINGLETIIKIREVLPDIPIIMISGSEEGDNALSKGANAYVRKGNHLYEDLDPILLQLKKGSFNLQ